MVEKWYDRMTTKQQGPLGQAVVEIPRPALVEILTRGGFSVSDFGLVENRVPPESEWLRKLLCWPDDCRITGLTTHKRFLHDLVLIRVESPAFRLTDSFDVLPEAEPVYRGGPDADSSPVFDHWEGEAVKSRRLGDDLAAALSGKDPEGRTPGEVLENALFQAQSKGRPGRWSEDRLEGAVTKEDIDACLDESVEPMPDAEV